MNIEGLDYNTKRGKLALPEYGREVQKMVDRALTIADRSERQRYAETIVGVMQRLAPPTGSGENMTHKYWDHLAIMSGFRLDIDYPCDIKPALDIAARPQRVGYAQHEIPARHYGNIVFEMFEKLKTMDEGPERDRLAGLTANHMKMCLQEGSTGQSNEERVASDLARFTDGKIQLDLSTFKFASVAPQHLQIDKRRKRK